MALESTQLAGSYLLYQYVWETPPEYKRFIVLLLLRSCLCSGSLPHGAVGLSAICYCGFHGYNYLFIVPFKSPEHNLINWRLLWSLGVRDVSWVVHVQRYQFA